MKKTIFTVVGVVVFGLAILSLKTADAQSSIISTNTSVQNVTFAKTLERGSSGADVKKLQELLKTMPDVYPEGIVSGYFGALTLKAVKRFQMKYGIESLGITGPKTRFKLNELYRGMSLRTAPISQQQPQFQPQQQSQPQSQPTLVGQENRLPLNPAPPILKNLGISFDGVNASGGPGDIRFSYFKIAKPFLEYGTLVKDPENRDKYLYEFAFNVQPETKLIAVMDGVITRVDNQGSDYEISLQSSADSEWSVNYDHITAPLPIGAIVKAGDVIAKPSGSVSKGTPILANSDGVVTKIEYQKETNDYYVEARQSEHATFSHSHVIEVAVSLNQNIKAGDSLGKMSDVNDSGFFELALVRNIGGDYRNSYRYCPLFAADPTKGLNDRIAELMKSWETYSNNTGSYDESRFVYTPGCIAERALNQ
jgi:peptidoglycan hydrolase-like protein with peptidoglycan-binding domain